MKSGNEPAIVDLKRAIKETRIEDTLLEESPKGDRRANGEAEVAVKEVAGLVRSMRHGLYKRTGGWIPVGCAAFQWLCEYAGVLITRFQVG